MRFKKLFNRVDCDYSIIYQYNINDRQDIISIIDSSDRLIFKIQVPLDNGEYYTFTYDLLKRDKVKCSSFAEFLNNQREMFLLDNLVLTHEYKGLVKGRIGNMYHSVFSFYFRIKDSDRERIVERL